MFTPRKLTLAESIYDSIDNNEYLNEIYEKLLSLYANKVLGVESLNYNYDEEDALRFADILVKSTDPMKMDTHRLWGQEIITILRLLNPKNEKIKYYLGTILSTVGNYRGLKSVVGDEFKSADVFDELFFEYEKAVLKIPGRDEEYFFHEQKEVFDGLESKFFSYSGPTSMGKSFVVQTFIKEQVDSGRKRNYAILVPTKALINEVKSEFIESLQNKLLENNYRVVSSAGDLVLKQKHNFIFVLTPERLHHLLIGFPDIEIDFLFIDEAHKISEKNGRGSYYYKVVTQLGKKKRMPTIVFASPNIPNPEVYLGIVPGIKSEEIKSLSTKYTPVCQFKFLADLYEGKWSIYNEHRKNFLEIKSFNDNSLAKLVKEIGRDSQNIIYCSSKNDVLKYSLEYAENIPQSNNKKLISLAKEIRKEIHSAYYLADLVEKGVAYHVGYLPANIRLRIEKSFERGDIRTIFCTSTLVEGVNLPADNLFITNYKNGRSNLDEITFRNLIGRVGRIKYNIYGNVILVRMNEKQKSEKYEKLLKDEVPKQKISIETAEVKKYFKYVVEDLKNGNIELPVTSSVTTGEKFEAMRKYAMILIKDITEDRMSPVRTAFSRLMDMNEEKKIASKFPTDKTDEDITLSYDQIENLKEWEYGDESPYPMLTEEDDNNNYDKVVAFLRRMKKLFKWELYEDPSLGKSDNSLRWYAVILLRWMRGNGLSTIIHYAIRYKETHPESGVWSGRQQISNIYDRNSTMHQNIVIAETLGAIENVLLFSISNYFRKYSMEYKERMGVDSFPNDWYEYVEYGTMNPLTIFLQQTGFSREAALYIKNSSNRKKYIVGEGDNIKIKNDILECEIPIVKTEAVDIKYNVPELFVS